MPPVRRLARQLRTLLGAALLGCSLLPAYKLLNPAVTGLAGNATRAAAEAAWSGGLWGALLVVAGAMLLALGAPARRPLAFLEGLARPLTLWPAGRFAALCGGVAFSLSLVVSRFVLAGLPSSVDGMIQLLHARVLLAGHLALHLPGPPAAWNVQNSLLTSHGWASVYPPLHTAALALGLAVRAPWLVGPVMTGTAATFVALSLDRLLPHDPTAARAAALLSAACPFLFFLGGTDLSHTTAGALAAITLWTALRAREGAPAWAMATGAAVGAFVCTRPWTGIVVSAALVGALWLPEARRRGTGWLGSRAAFVIVGGLPWAAALLGWNQLLFGHPFTLGYSAAFGPAHGLGFHADPWSNAYGPLEAVAYTGTDLLLLGSHLLESPLPATALVGLSLMTAPALDEGVDVLLAWALAGVAANFVYWHHGIHMGPRFLFETGPAWVALWVMALPRLAGKTTSGLAPRVVGWVAVLCLAAAPALAWERGAAYRTGPDLADSEALPHPALRPALVFAHGSWSTRNAARLVATGMRRDSVETALRRNSACQVDAYARWRAGGATGAPPPLELEAQPGLDPGLRLQELSPGNRVPVDPREPLPEGCLREAMSDRLGTVELEPLLWQAPPLPGGSLVVARDLGPTTNAGVLNSLAGYHPYVLLDGGPGRAPRLLEYREGMELLWHGPAPPTPR